MSSFFAVQGLYRGEWKTLFVLPSNAAANEKIKALREANPACKYRVQLQFSW